MPTPKDVSSVPPPPMALFDRDMVRTDPVIRLSFKLASSPLAWSAIRIYLELETSICTGFSKYLNRQATPGCPLFHFIVANIGSLRDSNTRLRMGVLGMHHKASGYPLCHKGRGLMERLLALQDIMRGPLNQAGSRVFSGEYLPFRFGSCLIGPLLFCEVSIRGANDGK